jgi:SAM-dependent methyltransferase
MNHVNYDLWFTLIQKIVAQHFPYRKPSILELGGGTGVLAKKLKNNGYTYWGSDYSFSMCKEAYKKGIPFFCADARHVPVKKTFPLAIFLYDGINYLTTLNDYKKLFSVMYTLLDAGGFFLFDITTEINSVANFLDIIDSEDFGSSSYIRHSYFDRNKKIQHNDFTIFTKSDGNKSLFGKSSEYHIQKIFSAEEILSVIPKNHFIIMGVWDNFSFNTYNSQSERIHFLLKKKNGP